MGDIKFYCSKCSQKIAVHSDDAGRVMECPICHVSLVIPSRPAVMVTAPAAVAAPATVLAEPPVAVFAPPPAKVPEVRQAPPPPPHSFQKGSSGGSGGSAGSATKSPLEARSTPRPLPAVGGVSRTDAEKSAAGSGNETAELAELRQQLAAVLKERDLLSSEAAANKRAVYDLATLTDERQRLQEALAAVILERDTLQNTTAATLAQSEGQFSDAISKVAQWRSSAEAAEEKCQVAMKEREEFKSRLNEALGFQNQATQLRQQLAVAENTVETLTRDREELLQEFEKAVSELTAVRGELNEMHKSLEVERRKVRELGQHFAESERERMELMIRIQSGVPAK